MKSTAGGSLHGQEMVPPPFLKQSLEGIQQSKVEETLDSMDMTAVEASMRE